MKDSARSYSRIYMVGDKSFRYNYNTSELEWVDKSDIQYTDDGVKVVETKEWEVVDSIGLSRENFEENPMYWCNDYSDQISEECKFEGGDF